MDRGRPQGAVPNCQALLLEGWGSGAACRSDQNRHSDGRSAFPRSWVKRKTVGAQIHSVGMQSRLNSAFLKDAGSGISLQALTHPCKRGFQGSAGLQVSTC